MKTGYLPQELSAQDGEKDVYSFLSEEPGFFDLLPMQLHETARLVGLDAEIFYSDRKMHTFSGGECTYCGHCKPCPADIDIAMVNKLYDLAVMQPEAPASLKQHYHSLAHHASECIGCRGCESRCPFGVGVADRMARTAELFGE